MPEYFIRTTQLVFKDAKAFVCINNKLTENFNIQHAIRQGHLVAPYLFLVIGEALQVVRMAVQQIRELTSISLPSGRHQQLISQYADDMSLSLFGMRPIFQALISLLQTFKRAFGMKVTWNKSIAYYFSRNRLSDQLQQFECVWAEDHSLSKLLGIPFSMNLATEDVDAFLFNKLTTKITFWHIQQLSVVARAAIVTSVLASLLWYFTSIWARSSALLQKIRAMLHNYL